MKRLGKIAVCLAGVLALIAGMRAAIPASVDTPFSNDPYAVIVSRNLFGLVAPPPPPDTNAQIAVSLPKITPQGIMGVFGYYQVLFKVAPAKPDPKTKDEYYILSAGQMKDEIGVVKIDDAKGLVTFDNHGTTQELLLVSAPSSGGAAPSAVNLPAVPGLRNPGLGDPDGGNSYGEGGRLGVHISSGPTSGEAATAGNGGLNFGSSTQGRIYQPPPPSMSKDESTIMIEAQRAALMNTPHPVYSPNLLPPTPLTEYNTPEGTGPPAP